MAKFTFIDLFAGIGGFRLGLGHNGGKCLAFSEINKTAIAAYCDNYRESPDSNLGDITLIKDLPRHDLLTGGVPCQSWSIAGKNLGLEDDRGQLWNDTIYLLNRSRPKAFIFENVKGLIDPRNKEAFQYILDRIRQAGYYAKPFVINSYDYGVPQNRVRVYIIGFLKKEHMDSFELPAKLTHTAKLFDFLDLPPSTEAKAKLEHTAESARSFAAGRTRFQRRDELNDFFLFNDIRNGHSTVHSWDIIQTTDREKDICLLLLANRRKKLYGPFDGNPLSLEHFQGLDSSIGRAEIEGLVAKGIFKKVEYIYQIQDLDNAELTKWEQAALELSVGDRLWFDQVKNSKVLKKAKVSFKNVIKSLKDKQLISCLETRYEFRYSKISAGINGVNRIYLPISDVFSTLVASDTNDYVATVNITGTSPEDFKERFLEEVYRRQNYRKITKEEACVIQGYPKDFRLPEQRDKWMKLLGNSVSVPVIDELCKAMVSTGVFDKPPVRKPAPQIKLDFAQPL